MDFYKHNSFELYITHDGTPAMRCKCKKTFVVKSRRAEDLIAAHKLHAPVLVVPTRQLAGVR